MTRCSVALSIIICASLGNAAGATSTQFVKLPNLKRVAKDTYTSGQHLIVTRFCHEPSRGDAILKFVGPGEYSGTKIFFENGRQCDVKAVYNRHASECDSRTGNSALDRYNNARCRDLKAQKFNQENARRADEMQRRLDTDKARLSAFEAESERRLAGLNAEAEDARKRAAESARRTAAYKKLIDEFQAKSAAIGKIKDPAKRARAYEQLRKEAAAAREKLMSELK